MFTLTLHPLKLLFWLDSTVRISCSLSWKHNTLLEIGKGQNWQCNYSGLKQTNKKNTGTRMRRIPSTFRWFLKILSNIPDRTLANSAGVIFSIYSYFMRAKQGRCWSNLIRVYWFIWKVKSKSHIVSI